MNQTCSKCVPRQDDLPWLAILSKQIPGGDADEGTLLAMKALATMICNCADYAIGYQAAVEVLKGMERF